MAISKHLKHFGGLRVVEYTDGPTPGAALRFPAYDDWDEIPSLSAFLDGLGDAAAELRGLVLGRWDEELVDLPPDAFVEALLAHREALANLQALFIGDLTYEDCEISWIQQRALGHLPGALPGLEWFGVRGGEGLDLSGLKSERLRGLVVQAGGLSGAVVRQVAAAELPALEHLELWLGTEDYGGSSGVEDLRPILDGRFPGLRHLGLRNADYTDAVAAALADAPVMRALDTLDLSMGTLGDDGARALLASPHLDRLGRLNIAHHYLSDAALGELAGRLGDRLAGAALRKEEEDEGYRYVQVGE